MLYYLLKSLFLLENKIKNILLRLIHFIYLSLIYFYSYQYCIVTLYSIFCIPVHKLYLHDFGQYSKTWLCSEVEETSGFILLYL